MINLTALTDWLLTTLITHGAPILFLAAYIGSLGFPFPPITLLVIAAGAFTRLSILDWRLALPACLLGSVLADNCEYALGRWADERLERRFGTGAVWRRALATFNRQGGWAILLTRFWLTPLAPAVNLIAGSRYPYRRFVWIDLLGEAVWVLLFGALGFYAGGEWEVVSQLATSFSGLSVGLVALVAGIVVVIRLRRHRE